MCYCDVVRPGARPVVTDIPSGEFVTIKQNTEVYGVSNQGVESASENVANALTTATHVTASAIEEGSYTVSRSIIAASRNILAGLNNIANAIEQDTKTKEFYNLLKEIEGFEDYLIEHKILKEAYQKMEIVEQKHIENDMTPLIAKGMTCLVGDDISIIETMAINSSQSPLTVLASLLLEHGHSYRYDIIEINGLGERIEPLAALRLRDYLDCGNINKMKYAIENTIKSLWDIYENALTPGQTHVVYEHTNKLLNIIPNINKNIELNNLRNLHLALRLAVREDKIKRALE